MLAVVSTSIVTGEGAGQTHRNHSLCEGRSRPHLPERMRIVWVGWGARDPPTREALL